MDCAGDHSLQRRARRLACHFPGALVENLVASPPALPLLVALHGATASGKTSLAIELAERFSGEIVSCDSVAVYRDLQIGTAKPTAEERARVPHHMLDVVSPSEPYTAGDYSRDARAVLAEIVRRGHMPIVAGGTGLYLRALLDGLFSGPQRSDELRERLRGTARKKGEAYLARMLGRLDLVSARRIHPNDTPKIIRAIEVTLAARQPMSAAWKAGRNPLQGFRILRIGLDPPRADLYPRINDRAAAMFALGLVGETEQLLTHYGAECRPLGSLGYRHAAMLLRGELSLADAIAATQQGHRNYAKRQGTWFRRELDVHRLDGFGDEPGIAARASAWIEQKSGKSQ